MGLDTRKPVFGDLRTTKAQTSLHILTFRSEPLLLAKWKVSYLDMLQAKFQFFSFSVAEQAGLNITLSETPKTGFVATRPDYNSKHSRLESHTYWSFNHSLTKGISSNSTSARSKCSLLALFQNIYI